VQYQKYLVSLRLPVVVVSVCLLIFILIKRVFFSKPDTSLGFTEDLSSFLDPPFDIKQGDGDGFTPVMSRKSLRKKQEVMRKKDVSTVNVC